jgi:hypothetical protein
MRARGALEQATHDRIGIGKDHEVTAVTLDCAAPPTDARSA